MGCREAVHAGRGDYVPTHFHEIPNLFLKGYLPPDVVLVQMKDVLDTTWNIAEATRIPVMADVDTGGG